MIKAIPFTKIKFITYAISLLMIIGSITGTIIRGGFNMGIDFAGGWNIQVQFAPVAFSIDYEGDANYEVTVLDDKFTLYELQGDIRSQVGNPLDFSNYATIQALAEELDGIIEGITTKVQRYGEISPREIISEDKSFFLSRGRGLLIHARSQAKEDMIASIESVRKSLSPINGVSVQNIGNNPLQQMFMLKIREQDILKKENQGKTGDASTQEKIQEIENTIKGYLSGSFKPENILFKGSEFLGPSFSQELRLGAIGSIIIAIILMLIYVWFRFKFEYGLTAIIALIHDVTIMIGVIGTLQLEVVSATLAAILTIIGYSINDTIVIFDRIRENNGIYHDQSKEYIINLSITQSLTRTIMTTLTTLLSVVAIYIFTTGTIKDFAFNLIVGLVVGTYSSGFIAAPLLLSYQNFMDKRRKAKHETKFSKAKPEKKAEKAIEKPVETETVETEKQEKATEGKGGKTEGLIRNEDTAKKSPKKKKKKKKK